MFTLFTSSIDLHNESIKTFRVRYNEIMDVDREVHMNNDLYTLEKLNEYQQAKLNDLDRQGRFIIHDETGISQSQRVSKNVRLLDKLYGFFRKRRSRRSQHKSL